MRFGGPHGRFGEGLYNLTGTVKVNLDHIGSATDAKPVITAVGVITFHRTSGPAIGRVLVHFDKNGELSWRLLYRHPRRRTSSRERDHRGT